VPWRFLDAGQLSVRSLFVAGVQKPSHKRSFLTAASSLRENVSSLGEIADATAMLGTSSRDFQLCEPAALCVARAPLA
jgi:hypothetical protein